MSQHYRCCSDSPYCLRNRFVSQKQNWTVKINESSVLQDIFFVPIQNPQFPQYPLFLKVSAHKNNLLRIRVEPYIPESYSRYDCSTESTVINQNILAHKIELQSSINENFIQIYFEHYEILIHENSQISLFVNKTKILDINQDDKAIFENNLKKDDFPDLFEPIRLEGQTDTIPNGPASIAISGAFYGENIRVSGIPSHALPHILPSTNSFSDPIRLFNVDAGQFPTNSTKSLYGAIPYLVGHFQDKSTGFFWTNPSETWIDIQNNNQNEVDFRFISESGFIDLFIFSGSHQSVVNSFTELTGKPQLPQLFSLGFHQSRWGYLSSSEILDLFAEFEKNQIPVDSFWLDLDHTNLKMYFTWEPSNFSKTRTMQRKLYEKKKNVVALIDPHIKVFNDYQIYSRAKNQSLFVKTSGNEDFVGYCWPGRSSWVDFLNPEAREFWAELYSYQSYRGSTSSLFIWNDMNEPAVFELIDMTIPKDTIHCQTYENREVHNLYGHLMVSATFEGLKRRDGQRPFILTRSFFAGTQKYAFGWSGDNSATWEHLKSSVEDVLTLGVCGFPFSGSDVGGFFDSPDEELLSRWYQIGSWIYPFFRCHCHHLSKEREPFRLPEPYFSVVKEAIETRYQLIGNWYSEVFHSHQTGEPVVRPIWWEFPDFDGESLNVLVGRKFLVCGIFDPAPTIVNITFPNGIWFDFYRYSRVETKFLQIEIRESTQSIPVFIRGGSIFVQKESGGTSTNQMINNHIQLIVTLNEKQEAKGEYYFDDGRSFRYSNGEFIRRLFSYEKDQLTSSKIEKENEDFVSEVSILIRKITIVGLKQIPLSIHDGDLKINFNTYSNFIEFDPQQLFLKDEWNFLFQFVDEL